MAMFYRSGKIREFFHFDPDCYRERNLLKYDQMSLVDDMTKH